MHIEDSVVPASSSTATADTDGKDLDFLVQGVRLVGEKSWTAFIKTFDRDKINNIIPYEQLDWTYVLVKITADRAKKLFSPGVIRNVTLIPLSGSMRQQRKWILTAKDADRKRRGESYVRYLGKTVIII